MTVLRARAAEEKEGRRQQLRAAAAALLDRAGYAATTMAGIAEGAGLAKGTTYLYYRSKEELFLDLLLDTIEEWRDSALTDLTAATGADPVPAARILARSVAARPRLVGLLSLLHPVLERGASVEGLADFRSRLLELWSPLVAELGARFEGVGDENGALLPLRLNALIAGLAGLADDESVGRRATAARAELAVFGRDFERELADFVAALLRGWPIGAEQR